MEWQLFISVMLFAITMTGTPGPNNVMLTSSGANFGYRKSVPHILGIYVGLMTMLALLSMGLGVIFQLYPVVQEVMKWLGSLYLLYLAWKIARAQPMSVGQQKANKPMSCFHAALFQYLNPKAWMIMVTAVGSFSLQGEGYWLSIISMAVIFFVAQLPTSSIWVGFGALIGRWLSSETAWRRFNTIMGMLTALCVAFIW